MSLLTATTAAPAAATGTLQAPIRTFVIVCVPMFLVLLDVNIVHVALPQIGTGFEVSPSVWSWVVDCYTLPLAITLLAGGRLTDRFGYRVMLAAGEAVFLVGSLGCAVAPSWPRCWHPAPCRDWGRRRCCRPAWPRSPRCGGTAPNAPRHLAYGPRCRHQRLQWARSSAAC